MTTLRSPAVRRGRRGGVLSGIAILLVAMVAIGLLVYPDAADWFARVDHDAEVSGYVERVAATPSDERRRTLDAAYHYNETLNPGPLTDPYVSESEDAVLRSPVYVAYEQLLRISGTDTIGTLSYPGIDVILPIYHGTTDEVISKGIGHLYGTSLPVGGPSTRAVLTAHAGLPQAKLLTNLTQARVGDTFWISVLGEDHYYRVESTETVLPGDTESLRIIDGQDWVTLFTCTPIGINSHRFMVHAIRIPNPDAASDDVTAIVGDGLTAGFPWWALVFVGGSALVALVVFWPFRRRRKGEGAAPGTEPGDGGPDAAAEIGVHG
ncbi:MAG: class C sortase [Protaetiibacter sp.]